MATLATVCSRIFTKEMARSTSGANRAARAVPVRAFANEDIYFFVKRIDNSRLVRQTDPQAGGVCWKMIGSVGAAALLLIGVLLPSPAAGRRAGVTGAAGSEAGFAGAHGATGASAAIHRSRAGESGVSGFKRWLFAGVEPEAVGARSRGSHAGNSIYPAAAVAAAVVVGVGSCRFLQADLAAGGTPR